MGILATWNDRRKGRLAMTGGWVRFTMTEAGGAGNDGVVAALNELRRVQLPAN